MDDVVFAASGPATVQQLHGVPGMKLEQSAWRGIEFHHGRLALHTDPIYAPANSLYWSFLNCQLQGTAFLRGVDVARLRRHRRGAAGVGLTTRQ